MKKSNNHPYEPVFLLDSEEDPKPPVTNIVESEKDKNDVPVEAKDNFSDVSVDRNSENPKPQVDSEKEKIDDLSLTKDNVKINDNDVSVNRNSEEDQRSPV